MMRPRTLLLLALPISLLGLLWFVSPSGEGTPELDRPAPQSVRRASPAVELLPEPAGPVAVAPRRHSQATAHSAACAAHERRTVQGLRTVDQGPAALLARIAREQDPQVGAALLEALQESEEPLDAVAVKRWIELARNGLHGELRAQAISGLGLVRDPDGTVRAALFELARDPEPAARGAALEALFEHVVINERAAGEVARFGFELAATAADERTRAAALRAVDLEYLSSAAVERVGRHLADSSPRVREAAAEVLGGARTDDRGQALRLLEQAYAAERDALVRRTTLSSIVEAGRHQAVEILERLLPGEQDVGLGGAIEDYAVALKGGEVELEGIEQRFDELQQRRGVKLAAGPSATPPPAKSQHVPVNGCCD